MSATITIVSVSMPAVSGTCDYARKHGDLPLDFRIHYVGGRVDGIDRIEEDIRRGDLVITDLMGVQGSAYSRVVGALKECGGQRLAIGGMAPSLSRLGGYDAEHFRMSDDDEENLHRVAESWKRAEPRDIDYIFGMLLSEYMGVDGLEYPGYQDIREGTFIMDPISLEVFDSREEWFTARGHDSSKGTVLLTYSGNNYPTSNLEGVRMLYGKLAGICNVLPVAMNSYSIRYTGVMSDLVGSPDLVVNVLPFRFLAGPMGGDSVSAVDLLRNMGATILSPFFMSKKSREEWESSDEGVNAMEFMINIFLPELDGSLCTLPIGFEEQTETIDGFGISLSEIVPLEERVDRIVGKVESLLSLKTKPRSERRIALIAYNYPPGEGNMFGGSFLDGAGSIANITRALSEAGYDVEPMTSDQVVDSFLRNGLVNEGDWVQPSDEIITCGTGRNHPEAVTKYWGPEPGRIMTQKGRYLIPGIVDGNLFIGLQPPRGGGSVDAASYHDDSIPPHHQYLSLYEWLREEFKADAIVHLGTHGTLEFLPGKNCAPSGDCYPDMIMSDAVHIYTYYVGNTSEAMIAKRRTHACLVSYMPPVFSRSDLYGDLVVLEESIAEYRESEKVDPGRAEGVLAGIVEKAENMRLPTDIDELEDELVSIRESLIPIGLHAFGSGLSHEDSVTYALNALRFPHDGVPALDEVSGDMDPASVRELFEAYLRDGEVPGNDGLAGCFGLGRELVSRASEPMEFDGLLRALDAGYLDAKAGGDAMKDPDVLPTGFNIFQFNPNNVPSMAAFERGSSAAEGMIEEYRKNTGSYPRRAAMVLWGLETSRTQGLTVGQICGCLGLRMVRTSGDFRSRFEVIPLEELGRPRVDVTVSMCGFFRDMFPNLIPGLSALFRMVGELDEPDDMNPIRADTLANRRMLEDVGIPYEDLDELSACRLFGPPDGEYGTGITDLVGESKWKDETELGANFTHSLRFAYTQSIRGRDVEGLLSRNHVNVDMVSQVRDSSDRELIDLDHYYEFLGGLSKAVEMARGSRASVFVVDGSGPSVRTTDVRRSIERGVRTRLLNPKWVDGLLQVRYHGAQNINERFENVLGLAATTGEVGSGVFDDMFRCYVEDEEMRARIRENNNWAYMSMLDRLFEAESRGYWDATDEELDRLREAYEECEALAEEASDSQ